MVHPVFAPRHQARVNTDAACQRPHRWSVLRAAALSLSLYGAACESAQSAEWSCYGAKPGHPTAEERAHFIREAGALAVKAERKHGVPAAAIAAMAIAESTYGWTRPAQDANNLFAWRARRSAVRAGRAYVPPCERKRGRARGFAVFESRDEAFDYVASRLAAMHAYRRHTETYKAARRRGDAAAGAVDAWLKGIARRYSGEPERFTRRIRRIMNDAVTPSETLSPESNLYRLSAGAHNGG